MLAAAAVANAGMWEGLEDANYVMGPKITEKDVFGKVVLLYYLDGSEKGLNPVERVEALYKSHDKKRFCVIGSYCGSKEGAAAALAKQKITFPVYKGAKLASDTSKTRDAGHVLIVSQYGKILAATSAHSNFNRDHEKILVEAITSVGQPPSVIPGIELDKYKALKNKLRLGSNLKGVIKQLEKDVEAANKKTATAAVKAKADEASSILSAISSGKSDIEANMSALTDLNPEEAYKIMQLFVKSFPDEAADYKDKLAELKTKAAEFKKQSKAK